MSSKDERGKKRPPPLPDVDPSKRKREPVEELEINFDEDVFDRVTKRPAAGPEKFAAEVMRRSGEMPESTPRNPTPLSFPPALGEAPGRAQDAALTGTEQQDTTSAISFPALEMPSISPDSVGERTNTASKWESLGDDLGDAFGDRSAGADAFFDDLPDDHEALDLSEVPHLPKRPPPAGSSVDPFHASLARERREAEARSPAAPPVTQVMDDSDDSDLPPALGGGGPPRRRSALSDVPAAFGPPSGALAFVDRNAHAPVDLTPSKHLPPVLTPSKLPKAVHHRQSEPPTSQRLRERYALGDFSGALEIAEAILTQDPDSAEALRFAKSCRDVLTQMYTARLSPMGRRVRIAVAPDQLRWLSLDHRAGFMLSLIDGVSTVEELLDMCGMPRISALKILCALVEQEVIQLL